MKSHNNNRLIVLLFIVIVLIGAGIYVSNYSQNKNITILSTINNQNPSSSQKEVAANGNIFYTKINGENTEIFQMLPDKTEKLIYKDTDESEKIKYILGKTIDDKIVVFMSPKDSNYIGSLYYLTFEGKTKLNYNSTFYQSPAISPDGETIAYITFSNVDFDHGFKLFISNINGENITKISQDEAPISDFSFSADSSKITYMLGNTIYIYDLHDSSNETIYSFQEDITLIHLYWNNNSNILATLKTNDSSKSLVYNINIDKKSAQKLLTTDKPIKNKAIWASNDFSSFYYITSESDIKLHDNDNDKDFTITKGDTLISWQK